MANSLVSILRNGGVVASGGGILLWQNISADIEPEPGFYYHKQKTVLQISILVQIFNGGPSYDQVTQRVHEWKMLCSRPSSVLCNLFVFFF